MAHLSIICMHGMELVIMMSWRCITYLFGIHFCDWQAIRAHKVCTIFLNIYIYMFTQIYLVMPYCNPYVFNLVVVHLHNFAPTSSLKATADQVFHMSTLHRFILHLPAPHYLNT